MDAIVLFLGERFGGGAFLEGFLRGHGFVFFLIGKGDIFFFLFAGDGRDRFLRREGFVWGEGCLSNDLLRGGRGE